MVLRRLLRRLWAPSGNLSGLAGAGTRKNNFAGLTTEELEGRILLTTAFPASPLLAGPWLGAAGQTAPPSAGTTATPAPTGGNPWDAGWGWDWSGMVNSAIVASAAAAPGPVAASTVTVPAASGLSQEALSLWGGLLSSGLGGPAAAPPPAAAGGGPAAPPPAVSAPGLPSGGNLLSASSWLGSAAGPTTSQDTQNAQAAQVFTDVILTSYGWSQPEADPTEVAPFVDAAPWVVGGGDITNPYFSALPLSFQEQMYFNNAASYQTFVTYFYGQARSWAAEAQAQGISDDSQLQAFFSQKLNAEFQETRDVLAAAYPGLTDTQYRLLMAMNLATGYYIYAPQTTPANDLSTLLGFTDGNCSQLAALTASFAQLQGISAQVIAVEADYTTSLGEFSGGHNIVSAGGMWLDAQTNIAFNFDPVAIQALPPDQRLPSLLANGDVYGFYNWYLNPAVRAEQIQRGLDGGTQAFFWYYYLAALGQGNTTFQADGMWLPPLQGP